MTKYKLYDEYVKSTILWLDMLPKHWISGNLRWFVKIYAGGTPSKNNEEFWREGTIPWLNSGSVNQNLIIQPSAYITQEAYDKSSAKWIKKNSLVMALAGQGKTKGMVAQLGIDATCNQSMAAIVPNNKFISKYLYWWLNSNYQNIRNMSGGDLRDGLNLELIGDIECPVPSINEQQKIVNFLDKETAKIDTLIEKQKSLIQLLEEKRQAVISNAVTKGLNRNIKMKDSGVEWLGRVPEHWNILKTKRIFRLVTEQAPINNNAELLSLYTEIGVRPRRELEAKGNKASTTDGYWIVKKGDLIVNKLLAWMGASGYSAYEGVTSPAYDILRPIGNINPKFYHYLFRSKIAQTEFKRWSRGIMEMRLRLYFDELGRILMPIPPQIEQDTIIKEIESLEMKYDLIKSKAEISINLLNERRTALISAAVTGKIDVRNIT